MESTIHFIVGPHRSGTTYLQTLLGCMPNVYVGIETHYFSRIIPYLRKFNKIKGNIEFKDFKYAIENITFLGDDQHFAWRNDWKNCVDYLDPNLFSMFIKELFVHEQQNKRCCLIEKTPSHLMHVDKISKLLPNSKFIIIIRDPRAIAFSLLKYNHRLSFFKKIIYVAKEIGYLNSTFRKVNSINKLFDNKCMIVIYEELRRDLKYHLSVICNFLNIPYNEISQDRFNKISKRLILPREKHKKNNTKFNFKNEEFLNKKGFLWKFASYNLKTFIIRYGYCTSGQNHPLLNIFPLAFYKLLYLIAFSISVFKSKYLKFKVNKNLIDSYIPYTVEGESRRLIYLE